MLSFRNSLNIEAITSIFVIAYLFGSLYDPTTFAMPSLPADCCKNSRFHSIYSSFDVIVS